METVYMTAGEESKVVHVLKQTPCLRQELRDSLSVVTI